MARPARDSTTERMVNRLADPVRKETARSGIAVDDELDGAQQVGRSQVAYDLIGGMSIDHFHTMCLHAPCATCKGLCTSSTTPASARLTPGCGARPS